MNILKKELDDILFLNDDEKNTIINIYSSWNICKNNHQYIKNINNSTIIFDDNYIINDNILNYDEIMDTNKRTLYIDNCYNLEIKVNNKFNHIILINCSNINITLLEGLITGIDLLHCNGVNLLIRLNKIFNINFGYSSDCQIIFDKYSSSDICIITSYCVNIKFILVNTNNNFKKYITNRSLFSTINNYIIDNNMNLSSKNDNCILSL